MPPVQTTYNFVFAPAVAGMIANQEQSNVVSRIVEDATAIPFGRLVFRGVGDNGITATPNAEFLGISVLDKTQPTYGAPGGLLSTVTPDAYQQHAVAGVATQGVIWVVCSTVASAGQAVFCTPAGLITDAASGDTAIPSAVFDSSCAAGGLVKVRLA